MDTSMVEGGRRTVVVLMRERRTGINWEMEITLLKTAAHPNRLMGRALLHPPMARIQRLGMMTRWEGPILAIKAILQLLLLLLFPVIIKMVERVGILHQMGRPRRMQKCQHRGAPLV